VANNKAKLRIGIAVSVIIAVTALITCVVPLKTVAYTVTVEYQETEPCETQVEMPLQYEVSIFEDYDVWLYEDYRDYLSWQIYEKGYVEHSNWDFSKKLRFVPVITMYIDGDIDAGGWYDAYITFYFLGKGVWEYLSGEVDKDDIEAYGGSLSHHKRMYIDETCSDQVTFFAVDIDAENAEWFYDYRIEPGTKTVTKTEYREVTKQRPETRYKEVTLLDYLLHYP